MKHTANAVSPSLSVNTPFTPTFLGSLQGEGSDTRVTSPVSLRSAPNESSNVFENTLAATQNRDMASLEASRSAANLLQEATQPATGPQITYLSESGPGGNLGAIYNAVLRYIQRDLWLIIDASNILRGQTRPPQHHSHDFGTASEILGPIGPATPAVESAEMAQPQESTLASDQDGFEFMSRVIWTEIGERILSEIGNSVFAAGRVGELHQVSSARSGYTDRITLMK